MKTFLLTDTHFGVRQNNMTWFRSQMDFFEQQFIPELKKTEGPKRIVHLGDVFDIKSTVSTYIATEVRKLFVELGELCDEVIVIAGNHDFYSPSNDSYCAVELTLNHIPNVRLVIREAYEDEYGVYIPWFIQEREGISELSKRYEGKFIFTHADLVLSKPLIYTTVFSGHIHIPFIDGFRKNLGSCFPLTFADHDSHRYFYILDGEELTAIPNKTSIRFWRLYGGEVDFSQFSIDDYIEWYVEASLLFQDEFVSKVKTLQSQFKNLTIIPQSVENSGDKEVYECDIESIINNSIPNELQEAYQRILKRMEEKNEGR